MQVAAGQRDLADESLERARGGQDRAVAPVAHPAERQRQRDRVAPVLGDEGGEARRRVVLEVDLGLLDSQPDADPVELGDREAGETPAPSVSVV